MKNRIKNHLYFMLGILACSAVWLQSPNPKTLKHEWVTDPPKMAPEAFFTNISHGEVVESPFLVRFGMSFWGIAPADQDLKNTGHHHLLIDTPLPIPIDAPIPFVDNKYVHFGKGQMETVLNLPVGEHTLRLLLADHKHRPYFIYSPEIKIKVGSKTNATLPAGFSKNPELVLLNPKNNEEVYDSFRVLMHASNLNIAHADTKLENTGYFRLSIEHTARAKAQIIDFKNGQSEAYLKLPKGKAKIQLQYVKNPSGEVHTAKSSITEIFIK